MTGIWIVMLWKLFLISFLILHISFGTTEELVPSFLNGPLKLSSNSTNFPYLMFLPLSISYLILSSNLYHPIHLFLLPAGDFIFHWKSATIGQTLLHCSTTLLHQSAHVRVSVILPSVSSLHYGWTLLLLAKAKSSTMSWFHLPSTQSCRSCNYSLYLLHHQTSHPNGISNCNSERSLNLIGRVF